MSYIAYTLLGLLFLNPAWGVPEATELNQEVICIASSLQKMSGKDVWGDSIKDAVEKISADGSFEEYSRMHVVWRVIRVLALIGSEDSIDFKNRLILSGLVGSNVYLSRAGFAWNASQQLNEAEKHCWHGMIAAYFMEKSCYPKVIDFTPLLRSKGVYPTESFLGFVEENPILWDAMTEPVESRKKEHLQGFYEVVFGEKRELSNLEQRYVDAFSKLDFDQLTTTIPGAVTTTNETNLNSQEAIEKLGRSEESWQAICTDWEATRKQSGTEKALNRFEDFVVDRATQIKKEAERIKGQIEIVLDNPRVEKALDKFEAGVNRFLRKAF